MASTTQRMESKTNDYSMFLWGLFIALALAGLGAWIYQVATGLQVTGLGQQVVWGMYIAAFFTTAAVGTGLLGLVGLSEFTPIVSLALRAKLLAITLASFIVTALLVIVDIGNPFQAWRLITAFRFNATMTWDFWALVITGVITFVYLLVVRKSEKRQKVLGVLGILAAFTLVIIEGVMLAESSARPMWGSLTIFAFLIGAIVAGLSAALWALGRGHNLTRWLGAALLLSFFIVLVEVITGLTKDSPRTVAETSNLLFGAPSIFFWIHVVLGILLPITLMLFESRKAWAGWIAGLALLGVLAEKLWMLAAGQAEPWLALGTANYKPTWVEFLVVIGMLAFGWLFYRLVAHYFLPKTNANTV